MGDDFLKTSPIQFSKHVAWSNTQEYADFAVFEITFNSPEKTKNMTNDYVNNINNQFKYL